ncbi:MAG TPA: methanogenesis marker 7 protein [Methanosarcinales archaeon]|nr:methanogenesis marker 7 protein [Methanosarcinales archaeon]
MQQVFEPVMYEGGVYKHSLILEIVEDLGGYIIQINVMQSDVVILMLVPLDDLELVEALAKKLLGKITHAPLTGTEIAIVAPTVAYHHLPHPACDIAEYLRRKGSKTNIIGLSRGIGRRIAQINAHERKLINEHDAALFIFGNFEDCIKNQKPKLYKDLDIPVIITGGPNLETYEVPYASEYIGNIGRISHRMRRGHELELLETLADRVGACLNRYRMELAKDPLSVAPPRVMKEIREQVPEVLDILSPMPITPQLNGVRVKLPYKEFHKPIEEVQFEEGTTLKEIAKIEKSEIRDYILVKILPISETGFRI